MPRGPRKFDFTFEKSGLTCFGGLSLFQPFCMELRAGNVHSSAGAGEFLNHVLDKLPSSIAAARTRLRLDGAFYYREIVQPLENQGLGHVVVARLGGCRVRLDALALETGASFRGRASARVHGAGRNPASPLHLQALDLPPRAGDQPGAGSAGGHGPRGHDVCADRCQQDRWHRYIYRRLKKKPAPRTGR